MKRLSEFGIGLLLLTVTTLWASAADPKRVFILDPFGRDFAPFNTMVSAFRATMAAELGEPADVYEVPVDLARLAGPAGERSLVEFLEGQISGRPVDLVATIGTAGVQFANRHRERLFPSTPVVVVGAEPRFIPSGFLSTNATLVTEKIELTTIIEDILLMQPQTTNIAVVFGASAVEAAWAEECRREFQSYTNRVGFMWFNGLPLEEVLQRCADLPPHSFIFFGLFVVDANGVALESDEALRVLHREANAPLFVYFMSGFGLGPIGGRLYRDSEVGTEGARAAIRILRGERPESIPPLVLETSAPLYDWRELQRWGVNEARLPPGSIIQFRQRGLWEQFHWVIVGTTAFFLLQAALIIGLLSSRSKRRRREAEANLVAHISSRFVNVPAEEVDHEIIDAQRRICESHGFDFSVIWQWSEGNPGFFAATHVYSPNTDLQQGGRLSEKHYPWIRQRILDGHILRFSSLDELPAEAALDRESARRMGAKSNLSIPLTVVGQPLGVLAMNTTRAERDWPDALVKRLQVVAEIFANALARKRAEHILRESEARLRNLSRRLIRAHEEERARLARDLHDDVTQRLARLAIDAGRAERAEDEVSTAERMRSVREGLVGLSDDIHALSYRLHPSVLEDLGLAEALKAECERFSRQQSIPAETNLGEVPAVVPPGASLCLFRVAQEALRNTARHAQARRVEISLRCLDDGLQLAVHDDGIGFNPVLERDHPSLGLASMRERVALLGGELDLESGPGQGTTILVCIPMEKGSVSKAKS